MRERVLADLGRRRSLLQAQVDELRSGRDRLLDAYRVVKRTLYDATDALVQVEARANAELAAPPPRVVVPPVEGELEMLERARRRRSRRTGRREPASTSISRRVESPTRRAGAPTSAGAAAARASTLARDAEDSGAAVDALFARLRASHTVDARARRSRRPGADRRRRGPEPEAAPSAGAGSPSRARAGAPDERRAGSGRGRAASAGAEPDGRARAVAEPRARGRDRERRSRRRRAGDRTPSRSRPTTRCGPSGPRSSAPLTRDLGRRVKRALQDEQNELLDQIRTIKGKVDADDGAADRRRRRRRRGPTVLDEPVERGVRPRSYSARRRHGRRSEPELPARLVDGARRRRWSSRGGERLVAAIDGAGDDRRRSPSGSGARYREFKGQELDAVAGRHPRRGVGAGRLRRGPRRRRCCGGSPAEEGRCPDCDDNALEPTVQGESFPTGQPHPARPPRVPVLARPADLSHRRAAPPRSRSQSASAAL